MPGNDIMGYFELVISPSLNIPHLRCALGEPKMPFVTHLISQLTLSFDNNEFVPRKDFLGNSLIACASKFYSKIWYNEKLSNVEFLICDYYRNLKKALSLMFGDFDSNEVCKLEYVDWKFQMISHLNVMALYCSKILKLPRPISKNDGGVEKFPVHSAVVMMDTALINISLFRLSFRIGFPSIP